MKLSIATSRKISLLSLLGAVLVVFLHAPIQVGNGVSAWIERFISGNVSSIAVPMFLIFSGFFLGNHIYDVDWYKRAIRKRVLTLLVPYLFWCVVLCIASNLFPFCSNVLNNQPLLRNLHINPIRVFGLDPRFNPPMPLWYMRELMLLVIISPVLAKIAKSRKWSVLFLCILLFFSSIQLLRVSDEMRDMLTFTLSVANVLWFFVGMFLRQNPIQMPKTYGLIFGVVGLTMFIASTSFPSMFDGKFGSFRYLYRYLAISFTLTGGVSICPAAELPLCLKGQSFPIYLMHPIFLQATSMINKYFPAFVTSLFGYVLFVSLSVAGCILIRIILERTAPKFANCIFGGR